MKKFKLKLSFFDIGMIVAFVLIGLLGGAAWWVLSGELADAQAQCAQVKGDYDTYSATKSGVIVSPGNLTTLQANMDILKGQIDPIIANDLLPKANTLSTISKEDPVAWKHDLDEDVRLLTTNAKTHNISLPKNFYFGFSRYLTESPSDAATEVLSKQRAGIKEMANILIDSPVKAIRAVRRTYEEDPHGAVVGPEAFNERGSGDQLTGFAVSTAGGLYTSYPLEVEFDSTTEELRPVVDALVKSPYVFLIRRVEVHNEKLTSPQTTDLDKMAGVTPGASSVVSSDPGQVAASTPTIGPQYLFGHTVLHVRIRVDMIEWNPAVPDSESFGKLPAKK